LVEERHSLPAVADRLETIYWGRDRGE